jgi:hypothetical protein
MRPTAKNEVRAGVCFGSIPIVKDFFLTCVLAYACNQRRDENWSVTPGITVSKQLKKGGLCLCCVFAAEQDCAENRDRGNAGKYKIHNTRIRYINYFTHMDWGNICG